MRRHTLLSFTFRYAPLFAVGCAVLLVVEMWPMLAEGLKSKPILLRGLSNFQLPVIAVEMGFIIGVSLVIGIGVSLAIWLLQYRSIAQQ